MNRQGLLMILLLISFKTFSQQGTNLTDRYQKSYVILNKETARSVARDLLSGDAAKQKVINYENLIEGYKVSTHYRDLKIAAQERKITILNTQIKIERAEIEIIDDQLTLTKKQLKKKKFKNILLTAMIPAAAYLGFKAGSQK